MIPRTKATLAALNEDDLRQEVLIPLFTKMGFRDVRHHPGSGELGKDIVTWTSERLLVRDDYAVVVKRGKISGRSSGAGSAAEVTNRIQKALGSIYHDSVTNQPRRPTRCWVVASGEIGPEARRAFEAALSIDQMRVVNFIDGEKLQCDAVRACLSG